MSERQFSSSEVEGYVLTVKLEHIVSAGVRSVFDDYPEDKPRIIEEALSELRTLRAAQELLDEIRRLNRECNSSYFSLKTRELLDAYDIQIDRLDAMKEGKSNEL